MKLADIKIQAAEMLAPFFITPWMQQSPWLPTPGSPGPTANERRQTRLRGNEMRGAAMSRFASEQNEISGNLVGSSPHPWQHSSPAFNSPRWMHQKSACAPLWCKSHLRNYDQIILYSSGHQSGASWSHEKGRSPEVTWHVHCLDSFRCGRPLVQREMQS
jgi:hypothetical protein